MPNVGGLGPIKINTNSGNQVGNLGGDINTTPPSDNISILNPSLPQAPAGYDHGNLIGLLDDDHPQYLKKSEASAIYQEKIWIGTTPPTNPQLYKIWIKI